MGKSTDWEPLPVASLRYHLSTIAGKVSALILTIVCAFLANKSIYMGIVIKDIREALIFFKEF